MVLVAPFVMQPRPRIAPRDALLFIRGARTLIVHHAGDEFLRVVLREIVSQPLQEDTRPGTMVNDHVPVAGNGIEVPLEIG